MIELHNINKTFRVAKRQAGFGSAVKALFSREHEIVYALNGIAELKSVSLKGKRL
jgi:ABC-2 type transport system ATP-binding protein